MELTINILSAASGILVFIIYSIWKIWNNKTPILSDIVLVVIAASMLPVAIGFIIYPFNPTFIGSIDKMHPQITLTGIVLFFVYSKTIYEKINSS